MNQKQFTSLRSSTQEEYGQVQTLCDIIKAANEEKHFKSTQEVFEGISPINLLKKSLKAYPLSWPDI